MPTDTRGLNSCCVSEFPLNTAYMRRLSELAYKLSHCIQQVVLDVKPPEQQQK